MPVRSGGRSAAGRVRGAVCPIATCRGDVFGCRLAEILQRSRRPPRPARCGLRADSERAGGGGDCISFRG